MDQQVEESHKEEDISESQNGNSSDNDTKSPWDDSNQVEISSASDTKPQESDEFYSESTQNAQNTENEAKTYNIFVGDLRSDVVEEDLIKTFEVVGPIHSVH